MGEAVFELEEVSEGVTVELAVKLGVVDEEPVEEGVDDGEGIVGVDDALLDEEALEDDVADELDVKVSAGLFVADGSTVEAGVGSGAGPPQPTPLHLPSCRSAADTHVLKRNSASRREATPARDMMGDRDGSEKRRASG